jgi:CDP-diacylglycerol--glycerol-3-phosphate 3-phosphatidyltransferase
MTTSSSKDEETPIIENPKPTLTDVMRVRTRFIIDPIVTVLAKLHVSPDLLTVVGMLAHILFAWLIVNGEFLYAGFAVMFLAPLDALDGSLARKLGKLQGGFGAFFDSTLDRIAEVILFAGFIVYFSRLGTEAGQWMVLASYLALTGSVMVSYTRSRAESLGYDCKVGLFSRVERYIVIIVLLIIAKPDWLVMVLAVGTWITVLQRVHHVWKQARS